MAEGKSSRSTLDKLRKREGADAVEKDMRYARLLLMAPDLLGGGAESSFEQGVSSNVVMVIKGAFYCVRVTDDECAWDFDYYMHKFENMIVTTLVL